MATDRRVVARDVVAHLALGFVLTGVSDAASSVFEAALTYDAPAPRTVLTVDFDGDGSPDLFSAGGELVAYLNQGNGLFGPGPVWSLAELGRGAVLADFNDDQIPDVAVERGTQDILVLLGDGDGAFTALSAIDVSAETSEIALGDFNGDTVDDLVVLTRPGGQDNAVILISDGMDSFNEITAFGAMGVNLTDLTVADLNLDGFDDFLLRPSILGDFVVVFLNTAGGSGAARFTVSELFDTPIAISDVEVAQVLGSPLPEILAFAPGFGLGFWRYNPGSETIGSLINVPLAAGGGPASIILWDHDGDLDEDVLLLQSTPGALPHTLIINGGAGFDALDGVGAMFSSPETILVSDVSGDGIEDVAVLDEVGEATLLFGGPASSGEFQTFRLATGRHPRDMVFADGEGDGDLDLAIANMDSSDLSFHLNRGDGRYLSSLRATGPDFLSHEDAAAVDLDADGARDVVAVSRFRGPAAVYRQVRSSGAYEYFSDIPGGSPGLNQIEAGDMNGDSLSDLVATGSDGGTIFLSTGELQLNPTTDFSFPGGSLSDLALADVDHDQDLDAVGTDPVGQLILVLENDGSGDLALTTSIQLDNAPKGIVAEDLNADGIVDLVALLTGSAQQFAVAMGTGLGQFSPVAYVGTAMSPLARAIDAADFNGDGYIDLVVTNPGTVDVFLNDSTGVFDSPLSVGTGAVSARALAAGDVNADGFADVVVGDFTFDGDLHLLLNGGEGPLIPPANQFLTNVDLTRALVVADMDGDADLDVVAVGLGVAVANGTGAAPRAVRALLLEGGTADGLAQPGDRLALRFDLEVAGPPAPAALDPLDLFAVDGVVGAGSLVADSAAMRTDAVISLAGASTEITAGMTQIDVGGSLRPGLITAELSSADAQDSGIVNINDTAVETLSAVGPMSTPISAVDGGTAPVSSDAAQFFFTGHALEIPPGSLAQDVTVSLGPPEASIYSTLPLPEAVAISTSAGPVTLSQPAVLRLEYDPAAAPGQPESLFRAFQIGETSPGALEAVPLDTSIQSLDTDSNTIEVQIESLNPLGLGGTPGVFATLPIEPITERTIFAQSTGSGDRGLASSVHLAPGDGSLYAQHAVDLIGYSPAGPADPGRIEVTMRSATLFDRISLGGGRSFPSQSSALFVLEARDAAGHLFALRGPATVTAQFIARPQPHETDAVAFDGSMGSVDLMRIARSIGVDTVDFSFIGVPQSLNTSSGLVTSFPIEGLTGSNGRGIWGAVSDPEAGPPAEGDSVGLIWR